jgi:hypothetical protein
MSFQDSSSAGKGATSRNIDLIQFLQGKNKMFGLERDEEETFIH